MQTLLRPQPQTVSRTLDQLADLMPDNATPTPDRFAEMHDEPNMTQRPQRGPACNGQKIVIVWHGPNHATTETRPCDCNEHRRCNQ